MELEIEAFKASEGNNSSEGQMLEPGVEAVTWAGHEDDLVEEPGAEQASEASPGSEAAEEPQESRTNMA